MVVHVSDQFKVPTFASHSSRPSRKVCIGVLPQHIDASGTFTSKSDYDATPATDISASYVKHSDRPHVVTHLNLSAGGPVVYAHDKNGNVTQSDGETIAYSAFNNPDRMRYRQEKESGVITYYLDKHMEIEALGSSVDYRHYLGNIAVLTKTDSLNDPSPGIKYLFRDRLGGVSAVGNSLTALLFENRAYDPYGRPRNGNWTDKTPEPIIGSSVTDRGFTDHEHLDDWQLIHMNGRGFDYNAGRFLSVDPFIQDPGNSQSINGFAYIMNNPLSGTDPSGYAARIGGSFSYQGFIKKKTTQTQAGHWQENRARQGIGDNGAPKNQQAVSGGHVADNGNGNLVEETKSLGQVAQAPAAELVGESGNESPIDEIVVTGSDDRSTRSEQITPLYSGANCATSIVCGTGNGFDSSNWLYHKYDFFNAICHRSLSGCTMESIYQQLVRYAGPGADGKSPIENGDISEIVFGGLSAGEVGHIVDAVNMRIVNIASENHVFFAGLVIRSVENREGTIGIRTFGEGTNSTRGWWHANILLARPGFNQLDNLIRGAVLNQTEGGRAVLKREQAIRNTFFEKFQSSPKY